MNREELLKKDKELLADTILSMYDAKLEIDRRQELRREIAKSEGEKKEHRKKSAYFTMMEIDAIRELQLTDAEKYLLILLTPRMGKEGFVLGSKKEALNQVDILKLTGWKSARYFRKILKCLVNKGLLSERISGRNTNYKLMPQYFRKGKRTNKTSFIKLINEPLKALAISVDAGALLFTAALWLEYRTGFIVVDNQRIGQSGLMNLIGWKRKDKINKVITELTSKNVMVKVKVGRQYQYQISAEYCMNG